VSDFFDVQGANGCMRSPKEAPIPYTLYHVTTIENAVDILATGAVLPRKDRRLEKHSEPPTTWGYHSSLAHHCVCLSFLPSWGTVRRFEGRELAILGFEGRGVLRGDYAVYACPVNSASIEARPYLEGRIAQAEALRACLSKRASAEVVVRGAVRVEHLVTLVLSDEETMRRWKPELECLLEYMGLHIDISARRDERGGSFPADHVVTKREQVRGGEIRDEAWLSKLDEAWLRDIRDWPDTETDGRPGA